MTSLREFIEAQGFHRISLKKLATGHYKLWMFVNGKKGEFILDTGASTSCIDFYSITHFLLDPQESDVKAAGAGATNMETKISENNTLHIGPINLEKQSFVLFDLTHVNTALAQVEEIPVQGILGADLLKKFRAVIDYGRNCLYIKE